MEAEDGGGGWGGLLVVMVMVEGEDRRGREREGDAGESLDPYFIKTK